MKNIIFYTCFLLLAYSARAQSNEEQYRQALDSLDHYLHFYAEVQREYSPLRVVSCYHPVMINGVTEDTTDRFFLERSKGRKDYIFITNEASFLILDLHDIDTSFVRTWRIGLRIADPTKKEKKRKTFIYNMIWREDNGRLGMLLPEYFLRPLNNQEVEVRRQKLLYYFHQVILLSRGLN